nr:uncharacterized protein LOC127347050 [Lolium perenne]
MEVEMEVEGQDEEAEREMAPKKLRIRGEAQVPDERREPTSHEAKALIIPNEKDNWTYDKGVRQPSSMIGALIRQYWPGFYTPVPGGEKKLAETWADYEAAPCPGFGTASDAVYTKFWTHYKVPDDMVEQGKAVLTRACQRLTRQQWYNQKHTCIGHFKAEQGTRVKKADNIRDDPQLTKEDYLKVMPLWCENKEDAFEALVARWVGEDADFNAKSVRNKANRGTGGTHSAGSRSTERYRKHKEAELGEPLTEVGRWQKMKLKQPDLSQHQPSLPEYFGYAEEELEKNARLDPWIASRDATKRHSLSSFGSRDSGGGGRR